MRDCCPANQFDGGCEDGICKSKAVALGRFEKANDMTGVFTPSARWQYGLVFIFAALSISYAATIGYEQQKRMDIIAQEQGHGR